MTIREIANRLYLLKDYTKVKEIYFDLDHYTCYVKTEKDTYLIDMVNKRIF